MKKLNAMIILSAGMLSILGLLSSHPASAQEKLVPSRFTIDSAAKSVDIHFDAAWNTNNGPFNFNGYTKGEATVVIPADWKAYVTFRTLDADLPHSALIYKQSSKSDIPQNAGGKDAGIGRAYTDNPMEGIVNAEDTFKILPKPENIGEYILLCGVNGHAPAGMWIKWAITSDAKTPYLLVEAKPEKPARP